MLSFPFQGKYLSGINSRMYLRVAEPASNSDQTSTSRRSEERYESNINVVHLLVPCSRPGSNAEIC
jgi:hypothetical protein